LHEVEAILVSPIEPQIGGLSAPRDAQAAARADQHQQVLAPGDARVEVAVRLMILRRRVPPT
jgi:hypothetical protein